jgi:phenylalanyl-tRNA synthetase alpha chain
MNKKIKSLRKKIELEIKSSKDKAGLDFIYKKYLDRNGEISLIFKNINSLDKDERVAVGFEANLLKKDIQRIIKEKYQDFKSEKQNKKSFIDLTLPGEKNNIGNTNLLTETMNEAILIFQGMGFSVVGGPELENEWYNFDALNFPKDHPAREMQDTLFIRNKKDKEKILLRTHTSPVQVRYMEENNPPIRIIAPGRVFRNEATDASHEVNFHQIEGLMIDRNISIANFKGVIQKFIDSFFGKDVKIRLRPSFFPFTEPSFEIDMSCQSCGGSGCSVCSQSGWLEIMGAGMVHPNVLKNVGINSNEWQGFAFGMGWERIIMMKYKINDIRLFYNNDLRFLQQF